jgi:hypothetical protein
VQCKPLGDFAQKRVIIPKGKNHGNNDKRKGRNAALIRKGASQGMPQRARIKEDGETP